MKKNKAFEFKSIIFFALIFEFFYILSYQIEPIRRGLGDFYLTLRHSVVYSYVYVFLVFLVFLYLFIFKKNFLKKISLFWILFFSFVFVITLVNVWPMTSHDIFTYYSRARISVFYNLNPYVNTYSEFPYDQYFPILANKWSFNTTAYGPFFTLVFNGILKATGGDLIPSVFFLKALFSILIVLSSYLIYKITNSKTAVFLYSWNPLVLYDLIINGHNEAMVVFLITLSLFFLKKKGFFYETLSLSSLVLASLVKYYIAAFLPAYIIFIFNRKKNFKSFIYFLANLFFQSFLVWVIVQPFGFENVFNRAFVILDFIEIKKLAVFQSLAALILGMFGVKNSLPVGISLGRMVGALIFIYVFFDLFIKKTKNFKYFLWAVLKIAIGLYLFFLNWVMPWYFLTLLLLMVVISGVNQKKYFKAHFAINLLILFWVFISGL